jgi:hypothetical protein
MPRSTVVDPPAASVRCELSLPTTYAARACPASSMPGSTSLWCSSSSVMPTSRRPPGTTAEENTPKRGRPSPCTYHSWWIPNDEGSLQPSVVLVVTLYDPSDPHGCWWRWDSATPYLSIGGMHVHALPH